MNIQIEFCHELGIWRAWDDDTMDGAPDRSALSRCLGEGVEPDDAIADLERQIEDLEQ